MTDVIKFTAKIDKVSGLRPEPGNRPQASCNLAGVFGSDVVGALWDMFDGHPVMVTIERIQQELPAQGSFDGPRPEQEAPCAHCEMMKGHAEDCPVLVAEREVDALNADAARGLKARVPAAFERAFDKPTGDAVPEAPRPSRKKKRPANLEEALAPMLCEECKRPTDDHAFGCAIGEARGEGGIDWKPNG